MVAASSRSLAAFDGRGELARISNPTLLLSGELDTGLVPASARELAKAIPDSELIVFAGVGHTLHIENPNSVNRQVIDFLACNGVRR